MNYLPLIFSRLPSVFIALLMLAACQVNTVDTPPLVTPRTQPGVSVTNRVVPQRRVSTPRATPAIAEYAEPQGELWQYLRENFSLHQQYQHASIDTELNWYLENPSYFTRITERAAPFLYEIVQEVESRGLPLELALVPIVESAFDPNAYSAEHAAGLWQFIGPTARSFGLQSDWWYDGRRDPLASTRAALDYLQYLHEEFDSNWLLALAAYNAGEGSVRRAVRRSGKPAATVSFWELRLPSETRGHIPRLLAAARLIADADQYGLTLYEVPDEPYLELVDLDFQIDLNTAAQLADIDRELLKTLNAGYLQWATHPDHPQSIVLPRVHAEQFRAALAEIPEDSRLTWENYRIQRGDTLTGIATRFNTSVEVLQSINKLRGSHIIAGRSLLIPRTGGDAAGQSLASILANRPSTDAEPTPTSYRVKSGDSLWQIAKRFGLKAGDISTWNSIALNALLHPGQLLMLQPPDLVAARSNSAASARRVRYEISKGDTLFQIARKFRVSVDDLATWNDFDTTTTIFPGQTIEVILPLTFFN